MRVYNETIETLSRYRRGGEQRVIIQHQQVNLSGQAKAVVGNFHSEGGGGGIKKEGEPPCQQYAEPKQEQTITTPVDSQPWQTDGVDSMVGKAVGLKRKKVRGE